VPTFYNIVCQSKVIIFLHIPRKPYSTWKLNVDETECSIFIGKHLIINSMYLFNKFCMRMNIYSTSLTPIRPQVRPDLAPPPAAAWASVHSCRRYAIATGLDHKSPGVKQVCIIGHLSRYLVLW